MIVNRQAESLTQYVHWRNRCVELEAENEVLRAELAALMGQQECPGQQLLDDPQTELRAMHNLAARSLPLGT